MEKESSITNTEEEAAALCGTLAGVFHGTPAGILATEARGQREVLASDTMPVDLGGQRDAFERLGFVFGTAVPGDPLFQYVTLPQGWSKKRGNHSLWTTIVDETGKERVSVFYKAAHYDRCAFAQLVK